MLHVLKFICACMVVQIHTNSICKDLFLPLCKIAVPFFFAISGFFMYDSVCGINRGRIKKAFFKILKITVLFQFLYFGFEVAQSLLLNKPVNSIPNTLDEFIGFLFSGFGFHLWYLHSYLILLVIVWCVVRMNRIEALIPIIPIGLILNYSLGAYSFVLYDQILPFYVYTNSITVGLPAFMIGYIVHKHINVMPQIKYLMIALVILIVCAEVEFINYSKVMPDGGGGGLLLLTIPLVFVVFVLCLKLPMPSSLKFICSLGKHYSLGIYGYHIIMRTVVAAGISGWPTEIGSDNSFIWVLLSTIVLTYVIKKIAVRIPFRIGSLMPV